jgi:hypothetical protein
MIRSTSSWVKVGTSDHGNEARVFDKLTHSASLPWLRSMGYLITECAARAGLLADPSRAQSLSSSTTCPSVYGLREPDYADVSDSNPTSCSLRVLQKTKSDGSTGTNGRSVSFYQKCNYYGIQIANETDDVTHTAQTCKHIPEGIHYQSADKKAGC